MRNQRFQAGEVRLHHLLVGVDGEDQRVATYLGYKMVKWVRSIELVDEYAHLWDGQGGFRQDNQSYGTSAEI